MPTSEGSFEDVREELDEHPMKQLFRYAGRYWRRLAVGIVLALVMRLMILVPDLAVASAIDRVIAGQGDASILADIGLMPAGTVASDAVRLDLLWRLAFIAGAAYVVLAGTRFLSRYIFQSTAQLIQHDLRNDTYEHMQRLSMDFYNDHQTGGMMAILNSDINRLENFFNTEIRMIVRAAVMVGVMAAVMLYVAPTLALVVLAPMPIIAGSTLIALRYLEPKYKHIREIVAMLNTRLSNNLGGIQVVKSFDHYDIEADRVEEESRAYRDEKISAIKIRRAFFSSMRIIIGGVFVAVLLVGGQKVIAGAMSVGTFTLFFLFLRRLRSPMQRLGKTANNYQKAVSSAERVFGVLGHEPTITSPPDAHVPDDVDGDVSFEDVTFSYEGHDETILDDVSLDVPAGATVGFAGTSGSGKSTLLKLVPRFHDVDEGSVRVDDVDVREYDVQALRDEIGVVEQSPYMFSGTVRDNIAYGDEETFRAVQADDVPADAERRIREVARNAGAHDFITDLPDGYDTQVGERGVKLSGGQRQRISIARALLNDPSLMILDEATSDVDTETEEIIQENLDQLIADRTAFVIAHRLSTIQDADEIVVMEDGEIVETGEHDDLIESGGNYAELWQKQIDASRPAPAPAD